jgi:hypothetical protein
VPVVTLVTAEVPEIPDPWITLKVEVATSVTGSENVAENSIVGPDADTNVGSVPELLQTGRSERIIGLVLSMEKPVCPVALRVFPAVSTVPTDAVTVPSPAGIVKVPV